MKNISTFLLTLALSTVAFASDYETIKQQMSDDSVGQVIDPSATQGFYSGMCYHSTSYSTNQALFWNSFVDANGVTKDLAMTTLQANGGKLSAELEFLLQPSAAAWSFMNSFVSLGKNGTGNNLGIIDSGSDFNFVYNSKEQGTTFTMSVSKSQKCSSGTDRSFCNPPVLRSCQYGRKAQGGFVYEGCERNNDLTVFKKLAEGKLISVRTADSVGTRSTMYSFYLAPVETYCEWNK